MMEINQITQMIIEFAPVITALIGILVSVIVGIRKIKNDNATTYGNIKQSNEQTINELKSTNAQLIQNNEQLVSDNAELKKANMQLREDMQLLMAELHDIHVKQKRQK